MSLYFIHSTTLTAIADAIREKTETSAPISVSEMASAIGNITGGLNPNNYDRIGVGSPVSRNYYINPPASSFDDLSKEFAILNGGDPYDAFLPALTSIADSHGIFSPWGSYSALMSIEAPACRIIGHNEFEQMPNLHTAVFASVISASVASFSLSALTAATSRSSLFSDYAICECAFSACYSLTNLEFSACRAIGEDAFNGCSSLPSVSFPNCIYIGASAFAYCSQLSMVSFPSCQYIGDYAFSGCSMIDAVSFPNCQYIGDYTFSGCSTIDAVSFPNCQYIGDYTFSGCSTIGTVSFPNCIYVGASAFSECTLLSEARFPTEASFHSYALAGVGNLLSTSSAHFDLILSGSSVGTAPSNLFGAFESLIFENLNGEIIHAGGSSAHGSGGEGAGEAEGELRVAGLSIYVPASLVSSFRTDWGEGLFSNNIYPYS